MFTLLSIPKAGSMNATSLAHSIVMDVYYRKNMKNFQGHTLVPGYCSFIDYVLNNYQDKIIN